MSVIARVNEWHIYLPLLRYLRCVAMEFEKKIFILDCV